MPFLGLLPGMPQGPCEGYLPADETAFAGPNKKDWEGARVIWLDIIHMCLETCTWGLQSWCEGRRRGWDPLETKTREAPPGRSQLSKLGLPSSASRRWNCSSLVRSKVKLGSSGHKDEHISPPIPRCLHLASTNPCHSLPPTQNISKTVSRKKNPRCGCAVRVCGEIQVSEAVAVSI